MIADFYLAVRLQRARNWAWLTCSRKFDYELPHMNLSQEVPQLLRDGQLGGGLKISSLIHEPRHSLSNVLKKHECGYGRLS